MSYIEKRRFPRMDYNRVISYYLLDENEKVVSGGIGEMKNISYVGFMMVTNKIVQSEYILFVFRDEENNVIEMKGKVNYSRKDKTGVIYTGIGFVDDDYKKSQFAKHLEMLIE